MIFGIVMKLFKTSTVTMIVFNVVSMEADMALSVLPCKLMGDEHQFSSVTAHFTEIISWGCRYYFNSI